MDNLQRTVLCAFLLHIACAEYNYCSVHSELSSNETFRCHSTALMNVGVIFAIKQVSVIHCRNVSKSVSLCNTTYSSKTERITLSCLNTSAILSITNVTNLDAGRYQWFIAYESGFKYSYSMLNLDSDCERSDCNSTECVSKAISADKKQQMTVYVLIPAFVLGIGAILFVCSRQRGNPGFKARDRSFSSTPLYRNADNVDHLETVTESGF